MNPTTFRVEPYGPWAERHQQWITALVNKMAARGITITEQQAWAYLAWCLDAVGNYMGSFEPQGHAALKESLSPILAQMFREHLTGKWEPPVGRRFESPQELADLVNGAVKTEHLGSDTRSQHGYL